MCSVRFKRHRKVRATKLASIDRQLRAVAEGSGKRPDITWALDATGVGDGVCEIIQNRMPLAGVYRVYLTGGINTAIDYNNRQIKLPKNQMVSVLLGCFDSDRIFISKRSRERRRVAVALCNISAGQMGNSYHSWRRFRSRNERAIRSTRHRSDPHYRVPRDHFSHPLASLVDTCRSSAPCGMDLVFPKSSLTTDCVLVSRCKGGPNETGRSVVEGFT